MSKGLTPDDVMPSGRYKGTRLRYVPASYLLFVFNNSRCTPKLAWYINRRLEQIKQEAEKEEALKIRK